MAPFSKEDKISIKSLSECKGYSAWQFVTEFTDKGWIAGEVEKVRNSATRNFRHFRRCNLEQILNT